MFVFMRATKTQISLNGDHTGLAETSQLEDMSRNIACTTDWYLWHMRTAMAQMSLRIYAQSRLSLHCSNTKSKEVDEDLGQI